MVLENNKFKIEVITNESGDWVALKKAGAIIYTGHSIPNWVFYDLLLELGANVETATITDKEMDRFGWCF